MSMSRFGVGALVISALTLRCSASSWASPENAWKESQKDATYVGAETCDSCHDDVVKRHRLSTHYGTMGPGIGKQGDMKEEACESCHGPGSLHADEGNPRLITKTSVEACFACHADQRAKFNLQFNHPVIEGRVSCADCHQIHAPVTTMSGRASLQRPNETCFKCHKEFKGPYVFEHEPMRENCQVCHEPHGGVYDKLLVADQSSLCLRCHWEQATNTAAGKIGGVGHGVKPGAGGEYEIGEGEDCIDHHRAVHGSNFYKTFNR